MRHDRHGRIGVLRDDVDGNGCGVIRAVYVELG
jgi:hypothetical protein